MYKMPPTVPISNLRNDQDEILKMMDEQPVMLTQRGKARAALVNIEQWNHLMDLLELYRAYWRAESARVQSDMEGQEWVDADSMIDEWAAKHGMGAHVPVPVE
ncbi:type II toxin-antitoxin system prevent-host-death family antitoxin [Chloroflexi bacterium TSY]|nr:type II toxin-antitoxin system prevent-host-death family antitoxin [Chloroflexi bacterium TSY]